MRPTVVTLLLCVAAFAIFVGVFSVAGGAIKLRYGDGLALIGISIGCLELFVAGSIIVLIALSNKMGGKTQGWLLIGCSIIGICTLVGIAVIGSLYAYSVDYFFGALLSLTGISFGALLILPLFVGIGTIRVTPS